MADLNPLTPDQKAQRRLKRITLAVQVLVESIIELPVERRDIAVATIIRELRTKVEQERHDQPTLLLNEL